jgi:hypothetical protein
VFLYQIDIRVFIFTRAQGRRVWDNLRKIMILNVPANLAQGLAIFGAYLIGLKSAPLTAVGVLYVNMIVRCDKDSMSKDGCAVHSGFGGIHLTTLRKYLCLCLFV